MDQHPSKFLVHLGGEKYSEEELQQWKQKAWKGTLPYYQTTGIYAAQRKTVELTGCLGEGVRVGIVDSGIHAEHPLLRRAFREGVNVLFGKNHDECGDETGHGTFVAGLIGGELLGIAPDAELYVVKANRKDPAESEEIDEAKTEIRHMNLSEAIKICYYGFQCDIINISIGFPEYAPIVERTCQQVYENGGIIVGAAGNNYAGPFFPANFSGFVIGVGALDINNVRRQDSTVWSATDIVSPGEGIFSSFYHPSMPDYTYHVWNGTSFASPLVTGTLALGLSVLKHREKHISLTDLEALLKETADSHVKRKEAARRFMREYDAAGKIFVNENVVLDCMYGAGKLRADRFLETIEKFK